MKTELPEPGEYYRPARAGELREEARLRRNAGWFVWVGLAACFWAPVFLPALLPGSADVVDGPVYLMKSVLSQMGAFAGRGHEMEAEAAEVVWACLTTLVMPLPLLPVIFLPFRKMAAAREQWADHLEAEHGARYGALPDEVPGCPW